MADLPENFIPESFVVDGEPDFNAFRADYDALAGIKGKIPESFEGDVDKFVEAYSGLNEFKVSMDKRIESLPETPDGYDWRLPEDFEFPDGLPEDFDKSAVLSQDDPDLPTLRELMAKHDAPQEMMDDLAKVMADRTLRQFQASLEGANEEKAKLGPDGQTRIGTVKAMLAKRLPASVADAMADGITSADALIGMEKLLGSRGGVTNAPPGGADFSTMTPKERIEYGQQQRAKG